MKVYGWFGRGGQFLMCCDVAEDLVTKGLGTPASSDLINSAQSID